MGFNRKILLLSLLLLGLFLSGCSDDTGAVLGITDAEGTFSFLLYDLPGAVESGSEQGIIWARILFGILITVILFGLSEVFIKVMKGARFIASLVVALIAVIGMPDKLMNEVFLVWGGGLYLLLAGVPVVLLTW